MLVMLCIAWYMLVGFVLLMLFVSYIDMDVVNARVTVLAEMSQTSFI